MNIERTHDKLYLKEDYKNNPKEYFKFVKREIEKDFLTGGKKEYCNFKMLDVGCETGSFLTFIRRRYPEADLWGMDIMPELLEQLNAGQKNEEKPFHPLLANIADDATLPDEKFDLISMLGVISIFDDFRPVFTNLLRMLEENGRAYIFGIFNPENLDILIKSRPSGEKEDKWETGWNTFSIASIREYCKEMDVRCEFLPFELGIDIPKHADDPLRSWTLDMMDGKKLIVNGLQLVHHFYLLKIWK